MCQATLRTCLVCWGWLSRRKIVISLLATSVVVGLPAGLCLDLGGAHIPGVPYSYRATSGNDALAAVAMVVGFLKRQDWQAPPDQEWLRAVLEQAYGTTKEAAQDGAFCQVRMEHLLRYCGVPAKRVPTSSSDFLEQVQDSIGKGLPVILACYDTEPSAVVVCGCQESANQTQVFILDPRRYNTGAAPQRYPPLTFNGFATPVSARPGKTYPLTILRPTDTGTVDSWVLFGLFVPATVDLRMTWGENTYSSATDSVPGLAMRPGQLRHIPGFPRIGETWTYLPATKDPQLGLCAIAASRADGEPWLAKRFEKPAESATPPLILPQVESQYWRSPAAPREVRNALDLASVQACARAFPQSPHHLSPDFMISTASLYAIAQLTTLEGWWNQTDILLWGGRRTRIYNALNEIVALGCAETLAEAAETGEFLQRCVSSAADKSTFIHATTVETYTAATETLLYHAVESGYATDDDLYEILLADEMMHQLKQFSTGVNLGLRLSKGLTDLNIIAVKIGAPLVAYDDAINALWALELNAKDEDVRAAATQLRGVITNDREAFLTNLSNRASDICKAIILEPAAQLTRDWALKAFSKQGSWLGAGIAGAFLFFEVFDVLTGVSQVLPEAESATYGCIVESESHRVAFETLARQIAGPNTPDPEVVAQYRGTVYLSLLAASFVYGELQGVFKTWSGDWKMFTSEQERAEAREAAEEAHRKAVAARLAARSWRYPRCVSRAAWATWLRLWGDVPTFTPPIQRHSLAGLRLGDPVQKAVSLYGQPVRTAAKGYDAYEWIMKSYQGRYGLYIEAAADGKITEVSVSEGVNPHSTHPGIFDAQALEHLATGEGLRMGDSPERVTEVLGEPSGFGLSDSSVYAYPEIPEYLEVYWREAHLGPSGVFGFALTSEPPNGYTPAPAGHLLAGLSLGDPLQKALDLYGAPQGTIEFHPPVLTRRWAFHDDHGGEYLLDVEAQDGRLSSICVQSVSSGHEPGDGSKYDRDALEHLATGEGLRLDDPASRIEGVLGKAQVSLPEGGEYEGSLPKFIYPFFETDEFLIVAEVDEVVGVIELSNSYLPKEAESPEADSQPARPEESDGPAGLQ